MLAFKNVSRSFRGPDGEVAALCEVSLAVRPSEFVAVRGQSGCGKTTLLLVAGTLLKPTQGLVTVDGANAYALSPDDRSRLRAERIGFVFQQFHLIPYLTVFENVLAPSGARPRPDAADRARSLIRELNIEHRSNYLPSQLSTGESQRTALARALLNGPGLLLADEPTGNLDEKNAEAVLNAMADFARKGGAVLLVTHEERAAAFAGRTLLIENGRLREKS